MRMRNQGSLWRTLTICVGCVLTLAAVGCGDDDDPVVSDSGVAGSGGSGGGGGGGKGGTGGAGGAVSKEQCVTETSDLFTSLPTGPSAACVSCICTEAPTAVVACNAKAVKCWGLIECVTAMCLQVSDAEFAGCVSSKCAEFAVEGAQTALPLQGVLQDDCEAQCVPDLEDAGTPDAG